MRKLLLGLTIALALGTANAQARKLAFPDISGKWCGEITDYTFARTALTVHFHNGSKKRVWKVKKYDFSDTWINVVWGFGGNTVFGEFSENGKAMAQQPNTSGDKGPRRPFHRC
jgi:hypothetical protein